MRERIEFVAKEGLADTLFHRGIKRFDISDGTVSVDQPVLHRPKASPWDFTLPDLKSRRASRIL